MNLADYIRDIPDFPKPGINFKDITPLLAFSELELVSLKGIDNISCKALETLIAEIGRDAVITDEACI